MVLMSPFINSIQDTNWHSISMGFSRSLDGLTTSTDVNPEHTYNHPGVYLVTLVVTTPYCGSAITISVDVLSTDIQNFSEEFSIEIYPNPVENTLHFNSEITFDQIQVYNILGQQVINFATNPPTNKIPVSDLKSGIYTILFEKNGRLLIKEFVKL